MRSVTFTLIAAAWTALQFFFVPTLCLLAIVLFAGELLNQTNLLEMCGKACPLCSADVSTPQSLVSYTHSIHPSIQFYSRTLSLVVKVE